MELYAVREYQNYSHIDHAYYTDKIEAKKHVKALRRYALLTGENDRENIVTVKIDVKDKYKSTEVPGSAFGPLWDRVVCYPMKNQVRFSGFVNYDEAASCNVNDVTVYIQSEYSSITHSWVITPRIVFYIKYVCQPYEQVLSRADKLGQRMLQRVNAFIDFKKYYGMSPWDLHNNGWTLVPESYERWELLSRQVEQYYKTDPYKPDKIDAAYMYKCCPGVFDGDITNIFNWRDEAYKTLEQIMAENNNQKE